VSSLVLPIFSAQKLLPLSLMGGCVIELELDNANGTFATANNDYEVRWDIVQPMILCDTVTLDPALTRAKVYPSAITTCSR